MALQLVAVQIPISHKTHQNYDDHANFPDGRKRKYTLKVMAQGIHQILVQNLGQIQIQKTR